jgi:hypothetical protein
MQRPATTFPPPSGRGRRWEGGTRKPVPVVRTREQTKAGQQRPVSNAGQQEGET